jgi:hypothetical protein
LVRAVALVFVVVTSVACRKEAERAAPAHTAPPASQKPLDRLAPGELAPGSGKVFGFDVPDGMAVRGKFHDVAYLHGNVEADALANYVRERVVVAHVEIGAARTVFPNARIKAGPPDRYFQIEVVRGTGSTELVIRDVTPGPKAPDDLSPEERWRRAGRRPDGRPFDITELR